MSAAIRIYQIYFEQDQVQSLDPDFIPYFNPPTSGKNLYEYGVFVREYKTSAFSSEELRGYVSWKFGTKAKISGAQFHNFIQANPGFDVYFINPFPEELTFRNVWLHGDYFHPGLIRLAQTAFDAVGYKYDLSNISNGIRSAAYSNYWVGNRKFWEKYMNFTIPIYDYLISESSDEDKAALWSPAPGYDKSTPMFPFVMERLFSTLLIADPSIKALHYQYSSSELREQGLSGVTKAFYQASQAAGPLSEGMLIELFRKGVAYLRKRRAGAPP